MMRMIRVCVWWLLRLLLRLFYRVQLTGLDELEKAGERVLIVANHTSFLDAILLSVFLPNDIAYAIHHRYYDKWWVKIVRPWVRLFAVDHSDPMAIKSLIGFVKAGHKVVIFPEGRITATGSLMKIYAGPGMVADKAGACILPIRIDGAQYSPFSRIKGQWCGRLFPDIKLTILAAKYLNFAASMSARERRREAGKILADVMTEMVFETTAYRRRVWDGLLEAAYIHGYKHEVLEDIERQSLNYRQVIMRSLLLGNCFHKHIEKATYVGVLLPNTSACVLTFLALQSRQMVPAMLNYSLGVQSSLTCLKTANIKQIITSRRFIDKAGLQDLEGNLKKYAKIIYLEDLRQEITLLNKILAYFSAYTPMKSLKRRLAKVSCEDAAVVLFTSGSEGLPKGVVLSHQNLMANVAQLSAKFDFNAQDICLNALPLFHSFGMTGGMLLPLLRGMKSFLYPSPLHYRVIPEIAYDINATVLFGTNVFLAGYGKYAHPYDFYSLRFVVAGAEKLQPETRQLWTDKFGLRILEGYGATEASPVIAVNSAMYFKAGSVGRLLPSLHYRIEPVEGIEQGGCLWVKGPNVMKGYLLPTQPAVLQPVADGWYNTGDIVRMDADGFVYIQGRLKRFSKIAGEMISLAAVEEMASQCWPDAMHVALSVADANKGEKLILMTTYKQANRKHLQAYAKANGLHELQVPKDYMQVDEIPLMGSGKVHYAAAQALLTQALS